MLFSISKTSISKTSILLTTIACAVAILTPAAQAANSILYISTTGSNSNACTLAQPCRSLQKALGKSPDGGEIHVLDSGFYGNNATIKKSITISGNGHTVSLGKPITVDDAGATVTLRRLVLSGEGSINKAIIVNAANALHIANCVVEKFTNIGIEVSGNIALFIKDTTIRDNGLHGLYIQGGIATIVRTVISGNQTHGLLAQGAQVAVSRSVAANNGAVGFYSWDGALVTVASSTAHGNFRGMFVVDAVLQVSNSTVVGNDIGIFNSTGTVLTRENNTVSGNTTQETSGTLTTLGGV